MLRIHYIGLRIHYIDYHILFQNIFNFISCLQKNL